MEKFVRKTYETVGPNLLTSDEDIEDFTEVRKKFCKLGPYGAECCAAYTLCLKKTSPFLYLL